MNDITNTNKRKTFINKLSFCIFIGINVLLLSTVVFLFYSYVVTFQRKLTDENIENITNLNESSANNAAAIINSWNNKLQDVAKYITFNDLSYYESLEMLYQSNSNEDRYFELISSQLTGHMALKDNEGKFIDVSFTHDSYEYLHKSFEDVNDSIYNDVSFMPEFTDNALTGEKMFAIYKHLYIKDGDGFNQIYTLILAIKSDIVLESFNNQKDFDGQYSVLVDSDGNYIVSNSAFKSTNFFRYLYKYNNLPLEEYNEIKKEVVENASGILYYNNAEVVIEPCVYCYELVKTNGWYCITCVPISSFHTTTFDMFYLIIAIGCLITLLAIDIIWLQSVNKNLKISMFHEKQANAAKSNFMSRMSHEIRTPLNAVIGYNMIAKSELNNVDNISNYRSIQMKVLDCLNKSQIASKHLLSVINDVLDTSAIESGKIIIYNERFDLKNLVTSLTTVFYSQMKVKKVVFEVELDSVLEEWFIGDQLRLNQILTNLLSNASKFTDSGGIVRMSISQKEINEKDTIINFSISDTGIGMSKEYLQHIWTPFEQADSSISRRFGGTGLGLSITKKLVDLMNGSINVQSEENVGTTFSIDLRLTRCEQPKKDVVCDFTNINALIIDDDINTCDYILNMFKRLGVRGDYSISGLSAIEMFKDKQTCNDPYNLCLVDWQMPEIDGIEVVKRLRKISGDDVPIIIISAYDFSEIENKLKEANIKMFVAKPLFQSTLFDLLANISGKIIDRKDNNNNVVDFHGARVLLAEDNEMNMEIAKAILENVNIIVDGVATGEQAVSMFETSKPGTYKAILMDIHMPVMDGNTAASIIRKSTHVDADSIPIIAMTADAFLENVIESLNSGMNDHISKPINIDILYSKLHKYINNM